MVTSVILNEKPAMISSADGLTGSLLNEPGEKELFLVLEFTEKDETKEHQTLTIELAQIGNGVAFDVPDDLIQYRQLRRITAREEDIYFHDTYDTIDVTLGEPFIGTAYQFHVNRTHPRQRTIIAILGVGIALLILGIIRYFRLIAR